VLAAFHRRTGIPILLNTSFNIAGEPIVETPEDALWCFTVTGMDACIMGDYVVSKMDNIHPILDFVIKLSAMSVSLDFPVEPGGLDSTGRKVTASAMLNAFSTHANSRQGEAIVTKVIPGMRTRLVTSTPWGPAKRYIAGDQLALLALFDGKRTGREILNELRQDYSEVDEGIFLQLMGMLRRISAIEFIEPHPETPPTALAASDLVGLGTEA
jgi:carbamoyltransferase